MATLQEVFIRIQENKKKIKDIRAMYKDALSTNQQYQDITDQAKTLREKKKQIETAIKDTMQSELIQMEDLKIDIASDTEMLSDLSLNKLVQGETVSVNDAHDNEYEPVFSVKFKKIA